MTPVSFAVLGRNVPFKHSSGGGGGGDGDGGGGDGDGDGGGDGASSDGGGGREALSLRYQVCHRLLKERFLVGTLHAGEVRRSPEGSRLDYRTPVTSR